MEYFYCYDKSLMKFLRYEYNFKFVCTGLHPKSKDQFWQFTSTPELHTAVKEFSNRGLTDMGIGINQPTFNSTDRVISINA